MPFIHKPLFHEANPCETAAMGTRLGLVVVAVLAVLLAGCSSTETLVISDAASLPEPTQPTNSPTSPPSSSGGESEQRSESVPEQPQNDSWQSPLAGTGLGPAALGRPPLAGTNESDPESRGNRTSEPQGDTSARSGDGTAPEEASDKVLYLTLDDGPWVPHTTQMLDLLEKHDATVTFFLMGERSRKHPGIMNRVFRDGHAVGNHTWNHANLLNEDDVAIRQQLFWTARELGFERIGACMRPPYGATDERVRAISRGEGYRTVMWDDHANDWNNPSIEEIIETLREATKPGAVLLVHDGGGNRYNTVAALKTLLPEWIEDGYRLEPVKSCTRPLVGPAGQAELTQRPESPAPDPSDPESGGN
jgi:peptidoglycan/xylan/chitin deacetylase (PgdA/CDA1 family)